MDLQDLQDLKNLNELDVLYKIIEIAENSKKRTEEVLHNNSYAGVDVRKRMQDIRLLSLILRDKIQRRINQKRGKKNKEESALDKAIEAEILRLKREDEKIEKLEAKRRQR